MADTFIFPKHPWRRILLNRDEFTPGKIIPEGGFFRMGMILSGENHPWKKILPNGDEFTLGK